MSRRYLTKSEADSALRRGKTIELFVGGCEVENQKCVRWASFNLSGSAVKGSLWEAVDQGSEDYLDIYTFDSPTGDYNEPVLVVETESVELAAKALGLNELNFVNQGVVQDEYLAYLKSST
jgi:hypothetical protein